MPMKLSVAVSRKVGMPDYGSVGASCSVELELDSALLDRDRAGFETRIRDAYAAAENAVRDELNRLRPEAGAKAVEARALAVPNRSVTVRSDGPSNGRRDQGRHARPATTNQVRAIESLARRLRLDLNQVLMTEYGVERLEGLTLDQASTLIDNLKERSDRR